MTARVANQAVEVLTPPPPGTGEDNRTPLDVLLRPIGDGRLVEISGERSAGRTALAYRLAAGASIRGELVGWVDLPDALDPRFLQRAGIDLRGLLWVRPPGMKAALRSAELLLRAGFAVVVLDLEGAPKNALGRLSPAVWLRLRRAAREARATAVILTHDRVTSSFSTLGLHANKRRAIFDRGLFEGLETQATVLLNRTGPSGTAYPVHLSHRPIPR